MKKTFLTMVAAALMSGTATLYADDLSGKISGVKSNAVIIYRIDLNQGKALPADTLELKHEAFSMSLPQVLQQVFILPKPEKPTDAMPMLRPSDAFVYVPGDRLQVNGSATHLTPSGTSLYDGLAALPQRSRMEALEQQKDSLLADINRYSLEKEKNKEMIMARMLEVKKLYDRQMELCKEVVESQPNSIVAAYLVSQLSLDGQMKLIPLLHPSIQNGCFKPVFDRARKYYDLKQKRDVAQKRLVAGAKAPAFALPDIDGKQRTLSEFQGKYVLLDFWGTWCGWCIKGIPQMKEYYARYKDQMEIVGICCNDTEDKWRAGVRKYELPWTNLYNGYQETIIGDYTVSGFPTKVLIDPQGQLVQIFVGETEELYKKLDQLFTK